LLGQPEEWEGLGLQVSGDPGRCWGTQLLCTSPGPGDPPALSSIGGLVPGHQPVYVKRLGFPLSFCRWARREFVGWGEFCL